MPSVLAPMRTWASSDLARPRERTRSLFYPFGGPDFTTAATLFPDAPVIVLIGLEPVGNLPEFDRLTPEGRADFFADMGTLALEFLVRGYFITMDMMDTYSERHVDGALPVIGFFLKREGFSDRRRPAAASRGGRFLGGDPLRTAERASAPPLRRPDRLLQGRGRNAPDRLLFLLRYREQGLPGGLAAPPLLHRTRTADHVRQGRVLPPPLGQFLDGPPLHPRPEPLRPPGRHGDPLPFLQAGRLGDHALRPLRDPGQGLHQRRAGRPQGGLRGPGVRRAAVALPLRLPLADAGRQPDARGKAPPALQGPDQ